MNIKKKIVWKNKYILYLIFEIMVILYIRNK